MTDNDLGDGKTIFIGTWKIQGLNAKKKEIFYEIVRCLCTNIN